MKVTKEWCDSMFEGAESKRGDAWGHRWRGDQKYRYEFCLNMLKDAVPGDEGLYCLDIGCALGDFTERLWEIPCCMDVTGVDISEEATRIGAERYEEIEFKNGTLPHLGFATSGFNAITALEVIGYLDDNERILAFSNIERILKPGGLFLFSGGINRGPEYFEPNDIMTQISQSFDIINVKYNYAYLYKKLSRPYGGLKSMCIAKALNWLTKKSMGQKGATHIFVLARNRKS